MTRFWRAFLLPHAYKKEFTLNININFTGFDKLQRQLKEAQRALNPLEGTIGTLKFNPNDSQSVKGAIRQMETAINSKIASYRNNPLVSQLAEGLKDKFRKMILERSK